jgi:hypothetical protein
MLGGERECLSECGRLGKELICSIACAFHGLFELFDVWLMSRYLQPDFLAFESLKSWS